MRRSAQVFIAAVAAVAAASVPLRAAERAAVAAARAEPSPEVLAAAAEPPRQALPESLTPTSPAPEAFRALRTEEEVLGAGAAAVTAADGRRLGVLLRPHHDTAAARLTTAERTWRVRPTPPGVSFVSAAGTVLGICKSGAVCARRPVGSGDPGTVWTVRRVGTDAFEIASAATSRLLSAVQGSKTLTTAAAPSAETRWSVAALQGCAAPAGCDADAGRAAEEAAPGRSESGPIPLFSSPRPLNRTAMSPAAFAAARRLSSVTLAAWAALPPPIQPVWFIDPADAAQHDLCVKFTGVDCVVQRTELQADVGGVPTYRGLYDATFRRYPNATAAIYSNADILFSEDIADVASAAAGYSAGRQLLMVGQRVNVNVPSTFDPSVRGAVKSLVGHGKRLYQRNAEDYFAASRGFADWKRLPAFALGGVAFDNWFVSRATRNAACISVDATSVVLAVHQNHGRQRKSSHHSPQSALNRRLATKHGGWKRGKVDDARYLAVRVGGRAAIIQPSELLHVD